MLAALALAAGIASPPVTFKEDIAPVISKHCSECHRSNGPAPFPLTSFAEVRRRATMIVDATQRRYMPPWMPDQSASASAAFRRARGLSEREIALIEQWAKDGFLEGTGPEAAPPPVETTDAWTLGPPDLIVKAEPYLLAADGGDVFRTFVAPTSQIGARYVRAFEFRAADGSAVHHANIKIDRTNSSRVLDLAESGPGYEGAGGRGAVFPDGHFLGWTPGQSARITSDGLTWTLPTGADLVFELHMMPTGRREAVQARVGLYFTDTPPQRLPVMIRLGRQDLDIPAGRHDYVSEDSYVLPVGATVLALQPHAHRIARRMRGWATLPDGTVRPLISIPSWNMSWQDTYVLQHPLWLPAGSRVSMAFTYDNSLRNPYTAVPPRRVTFGQTTRSEMGDLWVQVMPDSDRERLYEDVGKMMLMADIKGVEMMLTNSPNDPRVRLDLGFCYLEAGRVTDALVQLRHAVRLAPDSAPTHHDLAVVLLKQGLYSEARTALNAAIRLRSDFFEAYVNLGVADFAEGFTERAIEWYQQSLKIEPNNATAHYNLGSAYLRLDERRSAIRHYERAVELVPEDAELLDALAVAYARDEQVPKAIVTVRRALLLAEKNGSAKLREAITKRLALYEGMKQ